VSGKKLLDYGAFVRFRDECRGQFMTVFRLKPSDEPLFVDDLAFLTAASNVEDLIAAKANMFSMNGVGKEEEQFVAVSTLRGERITDSNGDSMWIPARFFVLYLEEQEDENPT